MAVMEEGSLNNPEGSKVANDIKREIFAPASASLGIGDILGFSREEMSATYSKACQCIAANDIASALKYFGMLIAMNHKEAKHWRGMGVCMQRMQLHAQADFFYSAALNRNADDVISLVFRAEARISTHKQAAARQDLAHAIEVGEKSSDRDVAPYVKRAKKVLQMLDTGDAQGGSFEKFS